ncbi:hypothetical protein CICLE_v10005304mg [Citrus x clementina]|uniref:Post-GPI attachment to proteins factor 3 n=1 Tax=Citrus clementina TaxID=85681 RepID=V4S4Z9_CITCL|nr:hypothetical protein CICLE_v10005304mg [Citrus x clementina]
MHMATRNWVALFVVLSCLLGVLDASAGDADPLYRACVKQCEETGCVGQKCFPHCKFSSDGASINGPWYMQEPLYLQWKKWDCLSDCRYNCMVDREIKRDALGHGPVKYHGKWPFIRVYGIQEPASVAFSVLNLAMHFHGWLSFFILLYYKLPLKQTKKAYYEFSPLWHIYGFLSMNSWFWSAVFHSRMEHESLCCHGSGSASHLGNLGWYHSASFSLEVVGGGVRRCPCNAARNL